MGWRVIKDDAYKIKPVKINEDQVKHLIEAALVHDMPTLKQMRRKFQQFKHPVCEKSVKLLDIAISIKRFVEQYTPEKGTGIQNGN